MIDRCRSTWGQDADWDLFAMGALDASAHRQMEEHLRSGCGECRRNYEAAMETMTALASAVPQVEPTAGIADALRLRIAEQRGGAQAGLRPGASVVSIQSRPDPYPELHSELRPAQPRRAAWPVALPWAIAAALALLALWLGVSLRHVSEELAKSTALARVVSVPGPVPGPEPVTGSGPGAGQPGKEQQGKQQLPAQASQTVAAREADASRVRALTEQLARLQTERDAAVAQWNAAQSSLAQAVAARGALQAQLAAAEEQAASRPNRTADVADGRRDDAAVTELKEQLNRANLTLAALRATEARNGRILAFFRAGPSRQIDLKSIDAGAGGATGVAYYAPDRGLMVMLRDLPQLPAGQCYQLWSVHKSGTSIKSVGLLATDGAGSGYLFAGPSSDLRQLSALTVTDEPKGGSISARGRKLLFGVLD